MSWIEEVIDITKEAESPRSFFWWAPLCAISAVVTNKVWLNKGGLYKLYPNLYVMFIAPSGAKKSFPVAVSRKLVEIVGNTRVISGRNSIQAIVKSLATGFTKPDGGPPIVDSMGYLCSGELASFLIDDSQAFPILMDLYDSIYNDRWKNTLKVSGVESLRNPIITMLTATNPDHFRDRIKEIDIKGGFIARTLIVYEDRRSHKNPLVEDQEPFELGDLAQTLKHISKAEGKFVFTPSAKKFFVDWYMQFEPEQMEDRTGTLNRLNDHVLKVAMCLSLARDIELVIELQDIEKAYEVCMQCASAVQRIIAGVSSRADGTTTTATVLEELITHDEMSRSRLLSRHYGDFYADELDRVIDTMNQADAIFIDKRGYQTYYRLKPKILEYYKKKRELKNESQ
jgi:hypothetical protein